MDKRVLFLDIDGVLNSETYHRAMVAKGVKLTGFGNRIDPVALFCLYGMLQDAKEQVDVVLSSTWRYRYTVESFNNNLMEEFGITLNIIDATTTNSNELTPNGADVFNKHCYTYSNLDYTRRGTEIVNWLGEHQEYGIIAALDDSVDIPKEILIRTNLRIGLNALTIDKLKSILKLTY